MSVSVSVWQCLTVSGTVCQCLTVSVSVWYCLSVSGGVWWCQAASAHTYLCLLGGQSVWGRRILAPCVTSSLSTTLHFRYSVWARITRIHSYSGGHSKVDLKYKVPWFVMWKFKFNLVDLLLLWLTVVTLSASCLFKVCLISCIVWCFNDLTGYSYGKEGGRGGSMTRSTCILSSLF